MPEANCPASYQGGFLNVVTTVGGGQRLDHHLKLSEYERLSLAVAAGQATIESTTTTGDPILFRCADINAIVYQSAARVLEMYGPKPPEDNEEKWRGQS